MSAALVELRVQPGARRSCVLGEYGSAIRIALRAPPTDGKANAEMIELVASTLEAPRSSVKLERGGASRSKWISVTGWSSEQVRAKLLASSTTS
jgi:uncharacterized protein (TIGR00251 family)